MARNMALLGSSGRGRNGRRAGIGFHPSRRIAAPADPPQLNVNVSLRGWARVIFKNPGASSSLDLSYKAIACGIPASASITRFRVLKMRVWGDATQDNTLRASQIGQDYYSLADIGSGTARRPCVAFELDTQSQNTWQLPSSPNVVTRVRATEGNQIICDFEYEAQLGDQSCLPD